MAFRILNSDPQIDAVLAQLSIVADVDVTLNYQEGQPYYGPQDNYQENPSYYGPQGGYQEGQFYYGQPYQEQNMNAGKKRKKKNRKAIFLLELVILFILAIGLFVGTSTQSKR